MTTDPRVAELEFLAQLDDQNEPLAVSVETPDRFGISAARFCDMVFHLILENCAAGTDRKGGGDETVAIVPGADRRQGEAIAEKLRSAIESEFRTFDAKLASPPTVSIGVMSISHRVSADEAFKKADELLLRAKREGKNRVVSGAFESAPT